MQLNLQWHATHLALVAHVWVGMTGRELATCVLVSIVVSIPACHAGDRGPIPRRGGALFSALSEGSAPKRSLYVFLGSWLEILLNGVTLLTSEDTPEKVPPCIGGSVVEFSPATREARVRFPANARNSFDRDPPSEHCDVSRSFTCSHLFHTWQAAACHATSVPVSVV